jgi:hypothetical protein
LLKSCVVVHFLIRDSNEVLVLIHWLRLIKGCCLTNQTRGHKNKCQAKDFAFSASVTSQVLFSVH